MKIAIDAGHGSNTAGKRTPDGYREHWINVMTASYLEAALTRCGFDTIKVGYNDTNAKDDTDVPLTTRQKQIKAANCDISVSCHANAYGNGSTYNNAQGVETLIHSVTAYVGDSRALADKIQSHLTEGTDQINRGVKRADLAMCNCRLMGTKASVLVEIAFMTNQREAELMQTDTFVKEQAEEIAHGVCDYCGVNYITDTPHQQPEEVVGIYVLSTDNNNITAGMVAQKRDNMQYSWWATKDNGASWILVQDWTTNNEWVNWQPKDYGTYLLVCKARAGEQEQSACAVIDSHPAIKGTCQIPSNDNAILLGMETYDNQDYSYEILIMDCSLYAEGKDAWIYSTGKCKSVGNYLWTTWQPYSGYFWALYRVYDATGNIIDEKCYGFEIK